MLWRSVRAMILVALVIWAGLGERAMASEPLALGAQDRLLVRVVAWNETTGTYENWTALTGEYTVGPTGLISLPIAGDMRAAGLTTNELAFQISERLQTRVSLAEPPSAAVEVVEFRPIYVIGDVDNPGQHAFSPGMTVVQAMALAGGLRTLVEGGVSPTEVIRTRGSFLSSRVELARLRAREIRLSAESEGVEELRFPTGIPHPDGSEAMQAVFLEEQTIFDARREALEREVGSIEDLQSLLNAELEALDAKGIGLNAQLARVRKAVGDLESLVDRGLARSPVLLDLQRTLVDLEGRELDLQTSSFRARQRLSEADRDIIDLRARRSTEAVVELQKARAQIELLKERAGTMQEMLVEMGAASTLDEVAETRVDFTVLRQTEAGLEEMWVGRDARVQPSDVIEVKLTIIEEPPQN
ncbi:MAG: polysaccharide biosynthesis/export family protein [Pseudomonadota bacterium]